MTDQELIDRMAMSVAPALVANFLAKGLDEEDPLDWMEGLSMDAYRMAYCMYEAREAGPGMRKGSDERQELIRLRRQVAEFRAIYREAVMDGMETDQLMIRVSKVEDLK